MYQLDEKKKNMLFLACFCGLLCWLWGMLLYGCSEKEFWYDEMAMVGFVCGKRTIPELLRIYLTSEASNLPLYALLLWPVYHFLPAQEFCLLQLSVLLTMGAALFLGLFAWKRYGKAAALAVLALCLCSTTVRNRIGTELRAYSLMFYGAASSMYCLLLFHEKESRKRGAAAFVSLLLLVFSHYFGVLFFALLGAGALLMVLLGKKDRKYLVPFFGAGGIFLPWFIATRLSTDVSAADFWIPKPEFMALPGTVAYLLGGNVILTGIFGLAYLLLFFMTAKKKRWLSVESFLLAAPALVLSGIFIYSRYISKGGGLYENRYFISILPGMLLLIAGAAQECWDLCAKKKWLRILPLLFFLTACYKGNQKAGWEMNSQARDASDSSDHIIEQGDAEQPDVRIVALSYDTIGDYCARGWADFYLCRQGGLDVEVLFTKDPGLDGCFEEYARQGVQKIYLMADDDFFDYDGTDYIMEVPENVRRLILFERAQ
ncbi:MAG: hypothetical protein IJ600_01495 [Lachnospiraceae bacterium]|nr:hypothetical protein [Lachnospiraceae bacterium]